METTLFTSPSLFSPDAGRSVRWEIFQSSPLGQLYQTIPFQSLVSLLPSKASGLGRIPRFSYAGGIGLQVLKHYFKVSDDKLIELLNGNWQMQYFCGMSLKLGDKIADGDVVSRFRIFLGQHLNIDLCQYTLAQEWKLDLAQSQTSLSDATCYESYIRYPTDVKLLWECLAYLHPQLQELCKAIKLRMLRSKFRDVRKAFLSYSKLKRKTYSKTKRLKRRLLRLLRKLLDFTPKVIAKWKSAESLFVQSPLKPTFFDKLHTINKVYKQQYILFKQGTNSIKNRIVSLAKPYVRPIVRGKENKRVEFGLKVNVLQVDGLNFMEHHDFEAFHEGVRLKKTIWKHQRYFGRCAHFGGDAIYANNANRRYCTQRDIFTNFPPKGRRAKDEKQRRQLRVLIAKERATRLEGSFGTVKNHYLLDKIKARTKQTEIAWVFFGQLTANAVAMVKKKKPPPQ